MELGGFIFIAIIVIGLAVQQRKRQHPPFCY